MSVIKYLTPEETAEYFKEHKKELEDTRVIIAEDPATDLTMYMTNENSTCFLSLYDANIQRRAVYLDGEDADGIADEVLSCYIEFFTPEPTPYPEPLEEQQLETDELNQAMYDREDELYDVTSRYLDDILDCYTMDSRFEVCTDEVIDEVLNMVCDYLLSCGMKIYRPHWVTNPETGTEEFVEYLMPEE